MRILIYFIKNRFYIVFLLLLAPLIFSSIIESTNLTWNATKNPEGDYSDNTKVVTITKRFAGDPVKHVTTKGEIKKSKDQAFTGAFSLFFGILGIALCIILLRFFFYLYKAIAAAIALRKTIKTTNYKHFDDHLSQPDLDDCIFPALVKMKNVELAKEIINSHSLVKRRFDEWCSKYE
ncbi:MAG: hypothetical protein KJ630_17700 [Proteobacteria bacterium]|nr:hypothetical protein [Pseudomonadota bacterium]